MGRRGVYPGGAGRLSGRAEKSGHALFRRSDVLDRIHLPLLDYYTGESSRAIFRTAGAETMNDCWLGFHTFDVEMAIDDLKDLYTQKSKNDGQ